MPESILKFIRNRYAFSLFLLFAVYLVGIANILLGFTDALMTLTPYNLLFATGILLYNANKPDKMYLFWFMIIAVAGFLIEWVGIETGLIFGTYSYGSGLGLKLLDVPLMIGVNWAVLVFAAAAILERRRWNILLKSAVGAALMVSYDILLEPVAIRFDFWSWAGGNIPLQNYLAWWVIGFLMLLGVHHYVKRLDNRLAIWIVGIQTFFFALLIITEGLKIF